MAMKYVSTNGASQVGLREAMLSGYAPDGGLYLPERLPILPRAYFNNIQEMTLTEIAYVVANTLMGEDVGSSKLKAVVESAFNFPIPLKTLGDNYHVLELFHGPTLAFKDISARFMAALLKEIDTTKRHKVVMTATTGNTGGAIANAFASTPSTSVMVLFPRGGLSRSQQAQFSTLKRNIFPLEISGTIAQCKRMVREAAEDSALLNIVQPVEANTQNILRILPQIAYFFHAYARLKAADIDADGFNVAIPCGNLSNLTSAIIAKRMGLPIGRIITGCSANDDFVRVLSGELQPDKVNHNSRPTLAKAMDTGYPTNLPRILHLCGNKLDVLRQEVAAYSVCDEDIANTVRYAIDSYGYFCDPHTAVALCASKQENSKRPTVVLATAHPTKSLDTMTEITGRAVELPLQLTLFMSKPVVATKLPPTYAALKKHILTNI